MDLKIDSKTCIVFDLDDTLYYEIDYLKSAFRFISEELFYENKDVIFEEMFTRYLNGSNVFEYLIATYPEKKLTLNDLLKLYREHFPTISLRTGAKKLLKKIIQKNAIIGLITNGRSLTQRNKINALGIKDFLSDIVISEEFGSEKPSEKNYRYFMDKYSGYNYIYVGDNMEKDFISPKKMGWFCIGVQNGKSGIPKKSGIVITGEYLPHIIVRSLDAIKII